MARWPRGLAAGGARSDLPQAAQMFAPQLLASGGYPWTVVPVEWRATYRRRQPFEHPLLVDGA
jgi:hypothetical protein